MSSHDRIWPSVVPNANVISSFGVQLGLDVAADGRAAGADLDVDAGRLALRHQRAGHDLVLDVDLVVVAEQAVDRAVLALGEPVGLDHDRLGAHAGQVDGGGFVRDRRGSAGSVVGGTDSVADHRRARTAPAAAIRARAVVRWSRRFSFDGLGGAGERRGQRPTARLGVIPLPDHRRLYRAEHEEHGDAEHRRHDHRGQRSSPVFVLLGTA